MTNENENGNGNAPVFRFTPLPFPPIATMSKKIFSEGILNEQVAFVTGGGTGITGGVPVRLRKPALA